MKLNKGDQLGLVLLTILVLFLAIFRNIEFLKNPTFFAEEGTYFYAQAYKNGWQSIWKTYSGYLQLPQTFIVTVSEKFFEVEYAPLFTALFSVLFTMIPVFIICFGQSVFNWGFAQKCALSIATVVCSNDANSYSVVHYNFIFSWIVALILLESDIEGKVSLKQSIYCMLLFLAPLSGPVSTFLFPFFVYNYFKDKSKTRLSYLLAISLGIGISLCFFLFNLLFNSTLEYNDRFRDFNPGYFFLKYFIQSLIGNSFGYFEEISRVAALLAFAVLLYFGIRYKSRGHFLYLTALIFVISIVPMVFSLGMSGGTRYFYTSNLLFLVFLMYAYSCFPNLHYLGLFVIGILLVSLISYGPKHQEMTGLKSIDWHVEVAKWRKSPDYQPRIYPFAGWDTSKPWRVELKRQ